MNKKDLKLVFHFHISKRVFNSYYIKAYVFKRKCKNMKVNSKIINLAYSFYINVVLCDMLPTKNHKLVLWSFSWENLHTYELSPTRFHRVQGDDVGLPSVFEKINHQTFISKNMKINSKNSETSNLHYIDWIGVNKKYLAHLEWVQKNLITNGVVYPSLGAHLGHISHDYKFYHANDIGLIT